MIAIRRKAKSFITYEIKPTSDWKRATGKIENSMDANKERF